MGCEEYGSAHGVQEAERKKNRGVLTVEAALVLPIFIMVMFFILSMLKLFYFHLVMQQALNNVGRTLAQYGYIIDETVGLEKFAFQEKTQNTEQALKNNINGVVQSGTKLVQTLEGGLSLSTIKTIISEGQTLFDNIKTLADQLEGLSSNPEETGKQLVNYLLVSAMNQYGGNFIEWMVGDYLNQMQASSGVITEIKYFIFVEEKSSGRGASEGVEVKKDIVLMVELDYDLPFFFVDKVRLQQSVRVHPWIGGNTKSIYAK